MPFKVEHSRKSRSQRDSSSSSSTRQKVLQKKDERPNSRERGNGRSQIAGYSKASTSVSHKRQINDDVPSPGSKENSEGVPVSPPASKRHKSGENLKEESRRPPPTVSDDSDDSTAEPRKPETAFPKGSQKRKSSAPTPGPVLQYYQSKSGGDEQPCPGTVKKLRLFNFMCHESFEKEWNRNLNFIVGENGSGKSAILSGIIVGLGGRAATTSRTKSIKGLVKNGKQYAKIEVTLINDGGANEAKYGKEITIQRVIDLNGVSTYKIQDGVGTRFRALRRLELNTILANFGILIDNPVAILNQETARSFLKTKDPRDKYKFFFEGASLGEAQRILSETQKDVKQIELNLQKSSKVVEERRDETKKYKELKKKLDEADRMEEIIGKLNQEYRWSLVIIDEAKRDELRGQLDEQQQHLDKLKQALDKLIKAKEELRSKAGKRPEDLEALNVELRERGKKDGDFHRELSLLAKKKGELVRKGRQLEQQRVQLITTIGKLEKKIEELSRTGEAELKKAQKEQEDKMARLQEETDVCQREIRELSADKEEFQQGTATLQTQLRDLQDREREVTQRLADSKRQKSNLSKNFTENKYDVYGPDMKSLMAKIQANQHRFQNPPRGPLGACFTVKNEKWVRLIELVLNSHLFTFVVSCQKDKDLLNELIKQSFQARRRPTIVTSGGVFAKDFDVSHSKASAPEGHSILDLIDIDNKDPVVRNVLLDIAFIERVLLFDTNKVACELLKDRRHPDFPRNCLHSFTLQFYQVTPDPRYRIDAKNHNITNTYLKCNSEAQIRNLDKKIADAEAELQGLRPSLQAKKSEVSASQKELYGKEDQIRRIQRKIVDLKAKHLTLSGTTHTAPDVSSFVDELNEKKEQLQKNEEEYREIDPAIDEINPKIEEKTDEKAENKSRMEELQKERDDMRDIIDNLEVKVARFDENIRNAKPKIRATEGKCEELRVKVESMDKTVQEKVAEAQLLCPRMGTARDPQSLQQEVKDYQRRIQEAKRLAGSREEILSKLKRADEVYRKIRMEYECYVALYTLLGNSMAANVQYYELAVQQTGNLLITCFQSLISSRGYKGRLIIEHETQELYYFVCPDADSNEKTQLALDSNNNKIIKNCLSEYTLGLSGGERSFATICYIISMWRIMECPFFMLDEFDVFMDSFNRAASQFALVSFAQRYAGHQFFLFTPLEISQEHTQGKNTTVTRMFPPKRDDVGNQGPAAGDDDGIAGLDGESDDEPSPGKRRKRGEKKQSNRNKR